MHSNPPGEGIKLLDEIHSMFTEIKQTLKSEDMVERKSMKGKIDIRMDSLVKLYDQYMDLHRSVRYINNSLRSCSPASYNPAWNRQIILLNRL